MMLKRLRKLEAKMSPVTGIVVVTMFPDETEDQAILMEHPSGLPPHAHLVVIARFSGARGERHETD